MIDDRKNADPYAQNAQDFSPISEAPVHQDVDALMFLGQAFCDVVMADAELPEPGGETFASALAVTPGGLANRAVAAARLGVPTSMVSTLGDDMFGREIHRQLSNEPGLDLSATAIVPGFQTPVSVALTGATDRSFITYEEPMPPLVWPEAPRPARAAHVNLAIDLPEGVADIREAGTRIVAGVGWDVTGVWSSDVVGRLDEVDVFVPNAVEAMRYTRTDDAMAAAQALAGRVGLVIVTCGADGVIAIDAETDEVVQVPAVAVDVVDPTGAGDVFVASWMAVADEGWSLRDAIRLATLCAAISLRGLGGAQSAPRRRDVLAFLRDRRPPGDWAHIEEWAQRPDRHDPAEAGLPAARP